MGRPPKDIKTTRRKDRDGRYSIQYLEDPGRWHLTPESDYEGAMAWAKRNRGRLLANAAPGLTLAPLIRDMFAPGSAWRKRQTAKHRIITDKGYANKDGHLRNYIIPLFGNDDPRELSRRYIDDKLMEVSKGRAPATMFKVVTTLNECLEELVDLGVIPSNPITGMRAYSRNPVKPREDIPAEAMPKLFPPAHGAMMRIWGGTMWVACFCVLHDTGMRPGELRALRWNQINVQERGLVVRRGIEAGTTETVKGTKTNIVRAAFLSERTIQELAIWRAESKFSGDEDFIFKLAGTAPVTDEGIIKAFRAGVKAAGLDHPEWTPYWMRHSFITHNLDVLEDREMETLAGHTSAQTNAIYRHQRDDAVLQRAKPIRDKLENKWEKEKAGSKTDPARKR